MNDDRQERRVRVSVRDSDNDSEIEWEIDWEIENENEWVCEPYVTPYIRRMQADCYKTLFGGSRVWHRCNRLKCPRLDCPPACTFPIRITTTPYRFISWPLWPMLKHWRPDNLARRHLSLLHRHCREISLELGKGQGQGHRLCNVMTNLLTSWCIVWCHNILSILFDILTKCVTSWQTFWHHGVLSVHFYVMEYF